MSLYRRNTNLYWAPLDNELLLFHQEDLEYYRLNDTGALIWDFLDEPKSLEEIASMLLGRFAVKDEECRRALTEFVESLVDTRLLVRD